MIKDEGEILVNVRVVKCLERICNVCQTADFFEIRRQILAVVYP